jgi:hypothetical protein
MQHNQHDGHSGVASHYPRLAVMIVLSFISMYVLMYMMGDSVGDVYNSLTRFTWPGS